MVVDLTSLYNVLRNTYQSIKDFFTTTDKIYRDPTPQDVPIQMLDENGNLITKTIPNMAKWRNTIWQDAQQAMSKIIYVDQQNGDDETGDGSQDKPFKSLQKAIDSVPSGGYGNIVFQSDYNTGDEYIVITHKFIILSGNNTTINVDLKKLSDSLKFESWLALDNSVLMLLGSFTLNIKDPNNYNALNLPSWGRGVFSVKNYSKGTFIKDEAVQLNVNSDIPVALFGVSFGGCIDIVFSQQHSPRDYAKNLRAFLDLNRNSVGNIWIQEFDNYLKDSNNNDVAMKDSILGIVKDNNGIPRNINSNIIL